MFSFPVFICFVCSDVCQIARPIPPPFSIPRPRPLSCDKVCLTGCPNHPRVVAAWPALRSTYVSCLPAEISFLSLSLFGVGGLVVFPAAAASLAGLAFSGWAFAFALRPTVHWPCNFLFTFLTPKISLGQKGWVLYALTCATLGIFGCGGVRGNSNGKWANILVCLLFIWVVFPTHFHRPAGIMRENGFGIWNFLKSVLSLYNIFHCICSFKLPINIA